MTDARYELHTPGTPSRAALGRMVEALGAATADLVKDAEGKVIAIHFRAVQARGLNVKGLRYTV